MGNYCKIVEEKNLAKGKLCLIYLCGRGQYTKGLCRKHWLRLTRPRKNKQFCKVDGCTETIHRESSEYCLRHYQRAIKNQPLDLSLDLRKTTYNPHFNNNSFMYPNHSLFKKNRLIIINKFNGKCVSCGCASRIVHHKDLSTSNHSLDNLIPVCYKCHRLFHPIKTSKFLRLYGYTMADLSKKLSLSQSKIYLMHQSGGLKEILLKLSPTHNLAPQQK